MPEPVALFRRRGLGDGHAVNLLIILDDGRGLLISPQVLRSIHWGSPVARLR
jgi:hypothetical protein